MSRPLATLLILSLLAAFIGVQAYHLLEAGDTFTNDDTGRAFWVATHVALMLLNILCIAALKGAETRLSQGALLVVIVGLAAVQLTGVYVGRSAVLGAKQVEASATELEVEAARLEADGVSGAADVVLGAQYAMIGGLKQAASSSAPSTRVAAYDRLEGASDAALDAAEKKRAAAAKLTAAADKMRGLGATPKSVAGSFIEAFLFALAIACELGAMLCGEMLANLYRAEISRLIKGLADAGANGKGTGAGK